MRPLISSIDLNTTQLGLNWIVSEHLNQWRFLRCSEICEYFVTSCLSVMTEDEARGVHCTILYIRFIVFANPYDEINRFPISQRSKSFISFTDLSLFYYYKNNWNLLTIIGRGISLIKTQPHFNITPDCKKGNFSFGKANKNFLRRTFTKRFFYEFKQSRFKPLVLWTWLKGLKK